MAQDQKRKQEIKGQRRYNAHIDSGDRLSVILQKSLPSLRRRILTTHHVFRDRRLGHLKTKHQKLTVDMRRTPERVLKAHSSDKVAHLFVDLRSATERAGFPSPKCNEAFAMPTHDRLRP